MILQALTKLNKITSLWVDRGVYTKEQVASLDARAFYEHQVSCASTRFAPCIIFGWLAAVATTDACTTDLHACSNKCAGRHQQE